MFYIAFFIVYLLFGLFAADRKVVKYAVVKAQRKPIMMAREGLKNELDTVLFYIALVVFWPLHIGRK